MRVAVRRGSHSQRQIHGDVSNELEYPIPKDDAEAMLRELAGNVVEKTRYHVEHARKTWEVDVFEGENQGLVVAEIELGLGRRSLRPPQLGLSRRDR